MTPVKDKSVSFYVSLAKRALLVNETLELSVSKLSQQNHNMMAHSTTNGYYKMTQCCNIFDNIGHRHGDGDNRKYQRSAPQFR